MLVVSEYPRTALQFKLLACDLISILSSDHQVSRDSGSSTFVIRSRSFTDLALTAPPKTKLFIEVEVMKYFFNLLFLILLFIVYGTYGLQWGIENHLSFDFQTSTTERDLIEEKIFYYKIV